MTKTKQPSDQHAHNNVDRMRRANSWLKQSEQAVSDDEKFIFLWIAFNAAYGDDLPSTESKIGEHNKFKNFLREIVRLDKKCELRKIIVTEYPGSRVEKLLQNEYVFTPFWQYVRGELTKEMWRKKFEWHNADTHKAMQIGHVHYILAEVFMRLYTLRNQMFHGGTTFGEGWGRKQLTEGRQIMADLVPVILNIMDADIRKTPASPIWGSVAYPRVNDHPQ